MPTCQKCGRGFPNWVKIDGKSRNLCRRRFCLLCSPFGERNTLDLNRYHNQPTARKYSDDEIRLAVTKSTSIVGVLDSLNIRMNGRNHTRMSERINKIGINTEHFLGIRSNSGKNHLGVKKTDLGDILCIWSKDLKYRTKRVRSAMIESGVKYLCSVCNLPPIWKDIELVLQIHHINGDRKDNRISNVVFLCPNCHSQTTTFGIKNARPHSS